MIRKLTIALFLMVQMPVVATLKAQIPAPHCYPCDSGK